MTETAGTQWYRVDLHVHTPISDDYKDKAATPDDIVQAALQAGMDAIAVTDHNTIAGIEGIRQAASGTELIVFPGVEINTEGGHLLALFDPNTPFDKLETALINAGIEKGKWGQLDAMAKPFRTAAAEIVKQNGLVIAAHADGDMGILTALTQGQATIRTYEDPNLVALELLSLDHKDEYVQGKVAGYDRAIACVQSSDAHQPAEVGNRSTLISMHHLALEGIAHAFDESTLRIRFPDEWTPPVYPHIQSLHVDSGFLVGHTFRFNAGLNCLVGGAGSGKSTVIEFLRFALAQVSDSQHIYEDCTGKLTDLAGIGATIEVEIASETGERFRVARNFNGEDNPITVTRLSDNETLANIDIRTLFPVHAYSQGEVVSISRSPLAQLELIDRHIDVAHYQGDIRQAYQDLASMIEGLVRLEAITRDRQTAQRDIDTNEERARDLQAEMSKLQAAQQNDVVASHHLWEAERTYLISLANSFKSAQATLAADFDAIQIAPLDISPPQDDTPNASVISACKALAKGLGVAKDEAKTTMLKKLKEVEVAILEHGAGWKKKYQAHQDQYTACEVERGTVRMKAISNELANCATKRQNLHSQLNQIAAAETTLARQQKKWRELLEIIRDHKERIRTLRNRKRKTILESIGKRVDLRLVPDGNRVHYVSTLTQLMQGSHMQKAAIQQVCEAVHPLDLAEYLRNEDMSKIDEFSKIGEKWAQVLIDRARSNPEFVYRLESARVEDLLKISYQVGENEYKALSKLSTGQKATVIVLLAMVEGQQPIIFDQPEDALYNPFVYSDVVQILRREKGRRQFILATHNPNIAVAGDSDCGIVLEGTATETTVQAAGGLDDRDTRELMLLHLEGGPDAFLMRRRRFRL